MASETTARVQTQQRDTPGEDEYQAFCAALSASARGRAFLAEFARRSRTTTTAPLLTAIERLHSTLAPDAATPGEALLKQKLRVLLDDIAAAQSELEANIQAMKSAKLGELVAVVEHRLAELMAPARAEPAADAGAAAVEPEEPRSHLAVVPVPEQPELPIPVPDASPTPAIALVHTSIAVAQPAGTESTQSEPAPAPLKTREIPTKAEALPPPIVETRRAEPRPPLSNTSRALPELDPLAAIKALSEEERLALFT